VVVVYRRVDCAAEIATLPVFIRRRAACARKQTRHDAYDRSVGGYEEDAMTGEVNYCRRETSANSDD